MAEWAVSNRWNIVFQKPNDASCIAASIGPLARAAALGSAQAEAGTLLFFKSLASRRMHGLGSAQARSSGSLAILPASFG